MMRGASQLAPRVSSQEPPAAVRSSNVHQANGSEADAILVYLPKPQDITCDVCCGRGR